MRTGFSLAYGLLIGAALVTLSGPVFAAGAFPVPDALPPMDAAAQPPTDIMPMPPPVPAQPEMDAGAPAAPPMEAPPPGNTAAPPGLPAQANAAPQDPLAQCKGKNDSDSMVHDCLRDMRKQADDHLDQALTAALKKARSGADWKDGQEKGRMLATSAMSFDAFRDSECIRRAGAISDLTAESDNTYLACMVSLTQMRIGMLEQ